MNNCMKCGKYHGHKDVTKDKNIRKVIEMCEENDTLRADLLSIKAEQSFRAQGHGLCNEAIEAFRKETPLSYEDELTTALIELCEENTALKAELADAEAALRHYVACQPDPLNSFCGSVAQEYFIKLGREKPNGKSRNSSKS